MTEKTYLHPPINPPIHGSVEDTTEAYRRGLAQVMTFELVVERLVEAWGFLRRMPDREAGWGSDRAYWPDILRHSAFGDYPESEPEDRPRLPGLRAAEVGRMEEALGWVEWVEPRDRKLMGVVLGQLQRESRPAWRAAAHKLGWAGHPDTLARRWDRAIGRIAATLGRAENGGKAGLGTVNPSNAPPPK